MRVAVDWSGDRDHRDGVVHWEAPIIRFNVAVTITPDMMAKLTLNTDNLERILPDQQPVTSIYQFDIFITSPHDPLVDVVVNIILG